jgi:hypothetical protein
VANLSLSFLNRRTVKQVCRVCREIAELKAEALCAEAFGSRPRSACEPLWSFPSTIRPPRVMPPNKVGSVHVRAAYAPNAGAEPLMLTRSTRPIRHERSDGTSTFILGATSYG